MSASPPVRFLSALTVTAVVAGLGYYVFDVQDGPTSLPVNCSVYWEAAQRAQPPYGMQPDASNYGWLRGTLPEACEGCGPALPEGASIIDPNGDCVGALQAGGDAGFGFWEEGVHGGSPYACWTGQGEGSGLNVTIAQVPRDGGGRPLNVRVETWGAPHLGVTYPPGYWDGGGFYPQSASYYGGDDAWPEACPRPDAGR